MRLEIVEGGRPRGIRGACEGPGSFVGGGPDSELPRANLLRSRRPEDALVLRSDGCHSFVDELLNALPLVGFRGVDVAFRIRGDAVHAEELTRLPPAGPQTREHFMLLSVDDVYPLVLA